MEEEKVPKVDRYWHTLYIEKEADPTDQRTDAQFCAAINLEYKTLAAWKSKYRRYIYQQVNSIRKDYVGELRAKANKELFKKLDKDTNALKLAFQLMGDLVEKTEQRVEYMSQEDTKRRINDLLKKVSDKQASWEVSKSLDQGPTEVKGHDSVDSGITQQTSGEDSSGAGTV